MRWCVIHHPELAATAVIAEDALELHRARGWRRVSGWSTNPDDLRADLARGAVDLSDLLADLDAEPSPAPDPAPEQAAKKAAPKNDKESS